MNVELDPNATEPVVGPTDEDPSKRKERRAGRERGKSLETQAHPHIPAYFLPNGEALSVCAPNIVGAAWVDPNVPNVGLAALAGWLLAGPNAGAAPVAAENPKAGCKERTKRDTHERGS